MERQLGFLLALSVPLAAGAAATRGVEVGGFNFSGFIWIGQLLAGVILIVMEKTFHPEDRIRFPMTPWLVCYGFLWMSLSWGDSLGRRQVQDVLQITMPLLMAMVGALFVRSEEQLRMLLKAFGWALIPAAALVLLSRNGGNSDTEDNAGLRLLGLTAALIGCVFLARWPDKFFSPLLSFGAAVGVVFLSGGRTAVVALLFVAIFHPLIRGFGWRAVLLTCMALAGLAVFQTEAFQERLFYSGSGTLADLAEGQFRGTGRFEAWPQIWDEAARRPVLGHGVGSAYGFVPTVWVGMNHVHNEYLRLVFETGFVGLTIFLVVLVWQLAQLLAKSRATTGEARCAFAASFLGLLLFALTALTGNPLPSNVWFMNPLFVIMGAAYGVAGRTGEALPAAAPAEARGPQHSRELFAHG